MKLIAILALIACAAACEKGNQVDQTTLASATLPATRPDPNAPSGGAPNGSSTSDANGNLQPATTDQALGTTTSTDINDEQDLDTTASIRRTLLADNTLSVQAKNVAIATTDGVVTINGVVRTMAEKTRIDNEARTAAGEKRVVNRLTLQVVP